GLYGSTEARGFWGRALSASSGQVTILTSSNPRRMAASARWRASPECPQITGSARTTITRRRVGISAFIVIGGDLSARGRTGWTGWGTDRGTPRGGGRAEGDEEVTGAVELATGDPGALERLAVE